MRSVLCIIDRISCGDHFLYFTARKKTHRNKIYARNDTLHLLMNRERGITQVYSFDLVNQQVFTRPIAHNGAGSKAGMKTFHGGGGMWMGGGVPGTPMVILKF